jgi:peptidoglycan/LPS O-acetylase OafA/YrhL
MIIPISGENEFDFSAERITKFISFITSDPLNSLQYVTSFFGPYGLPFFIFCSGYGLVTLYKDQMINYREFIIKRLIKLYPAFTIAIVFLLIYQYVIFDMQFTVRSAAALFIRYTQIANFIPGKHLALSGPYWFYSMIIQLYLCFPLLLSIQKRSSYGLWIIMAVSYLAIFLTSNFFLSYQISLYANFVGNLPVFLLGMILADTKKQNFSVWLWILSVIIFIAGQFVIYFWYFSQIASAIIVIPILVWINNKISNAKISKFMVFTGSISMYLFAVNGFLRMPWVDMSNNAAFHVYSYLYFLIYIGIVFVVALIIKKIEKYIMGWIRNKYHFLQDKI